MAEKRDVEFRIDGTKLAGWLFLPDGASPQHKAPAVAMAHGLGAVKEMYLEPFARRFARAGIAALVFDYRAFGASGGEPRQRVSPHDQMEDFRGALTFLSLQPQIDADRLGLWGSSFAGGHVVEVAAKDPRVKTVVAQAGAMDLRRIVVTALGAEGLAGLEQMTVKERARHFVEGGEVYIANALPPGNGLALQPDAASFEFATRAQATVAPNWRNEVTLSSIAAVIEHAPGRFVDLVAPRPLLMILMKGDTMTTPDTIRDAFARAGAPKELLELDGGHYDVYLGAASERAAQAAADWFAAHLRAGRAT
ncbi:MAG: alpha/beta fold hydrolase [Rhizomicrobium sp.]